MRRALPRSPLLALIAPFLGALCGCGGAGDSRPAPAATPPNVLLLVMDTTRADHLAIHGYPRPTTPRLAELAQDAAVFRNAWSPSGWTVPAHASLFTGLRPEHHGLKLDQRPFLPPTTLTLAERFQKAGYATAGFSNNGLVSGDFGLTRGFDHFQELFVHVPAGAFATHELAANWAYAAHQKGKPFFLFINDMEPHVPYAPPAGFYEAFLPERTRYEELHRARSFDFKESLGFIIGKLPLDERQIAMMRALYDGEILALDAAIGQLMDRLRKHGLFDNTIIVITSDHGENLGEHGLVDHKFSLHRTLLHVPLLIRFPGRFDGGREVAELVRLEDVAPTVLELAGLEVPDKLDGVTLTGPLEGRIARAVYDRTMWVYPTAQAWYPDIGRERFERSLKSVFDGRHHYILSSDGQEELYDLQRDPEELENLAATATAEKEALRKLLSSD